MLKVCIYAGINADVSLDDAQTECEDRARILKQNSQFWASNKSGANTGHCGAHL